MLGDFCVWQVENQTIVKNFKSELSIFMKSSFNLMWFPMSKARERAKPPPAVFCMKRDLYFRNMVECTYRLEESSKSAHKELDTLEKK